MGKWTPPADKPLKGMKRCRRTDCSNGLHCFLKHRTRRTPEGTCITCGVDLIDWSRVHRRDLRDVSHTIEVLKSEHIRHEFWCTVPLTDRAITYARRLGRGGVLASARARIASAVGKPANDWDGRQTPWEDKGHALHYAQHATATCCRKCIEVWHGIARKEELSATDVEYFAQLLFKYVVTRIPDLAEERMKTPRKARPLPNRGMDRAS
jgi:hypothetical protein